jgi:flagellar hook protein FlgE
MIYPMNQSMSALDAYRKKMDVTANNIANVNTDEFKKSRVNLKEGPHGGVQAEVQQIDTPGIPKKVVRGNKTVQVASSNVDLAKELTQTIPTKAAYTANLQTLKTSNEMIGSFLNILG